MELELSINGVVTSQDVSPGETLLALLRREGYSSVRRGCETGECGSCTIMVEGTPRPSCVMLAGQAGGCALTTVEGILNGGRLHPLQAAFIEVGATPCGFCTSGMLLSAYALLKKQPSPSEEEVRDALAGHICRCSGYEKPVQAVLRAAAVLRGETVFPLSVATIHAQEPAQAHKGKLLSVLAGSAASASGNTMQMPAIKIGTQRNAEIDTVPETPQFSNNAATSASADGVETQFQLVGKSLPAINAVKQVIGRASYAEDFSPRSMLYAQILTSPHAHAMIKSINVADARALPGVHAVLTYKDVPHVPFASVESAQFEQTLQDRYYLDAHLRYVGDRVAVVVAETADIAAQALSLIEVEYEMLPAVLDPRHSIDRQAPRIHPEKEAQGIYGADRNVAARIHTEIGDVDTGFAKADFVIEGEYTCSPSHVAPLENHTVTTYFDEDDTLVVRSSCQAPHHVRRTLAALLGLPARNIRVIATETGGGSGGRAEIVGEDLCALLTVITRRPILLSLSRKEEFAGSVRPQHVVRLKTGVMKDGTIVANQMAVLADTGAYGNHHLITQRHMNVNALALYPCSHMRFIAELLYTNRAPALSFNGNNAFQEFFALESHMDEIAKRIGLDALDLRRKNWLQAGKDYSLGYDATTSKELSWHVESTGLADCLQTVADRLNWPEKRQGRSARHGRFRRGVGIALAFHGVPDGQGVSSGAMIKLNEDGCFDVFVRIPDGGSGMMTVIAQIAGEVLGVDIASIVLHMTETDIAPLTNGVGDAVALYGSGSAVRRASEQLRRQILTVAGRLLNVLPETLRVNNGTIYAPDGRQIHMTQIASASFFQDGRQLMTTATTKMTRTPATFGVQGVAVEVDTETGFVRVLDVVTATDVGRALHPQLLETSIQGQVVQALGVALSEEILYDQQGHLLTTSFNDYGIYRAPDVPPVHTFLVETEDQLAPFGAKALASVPFLALTPALANAVADALDIRLRTVPFTPERILRAIHAQKK